MRAYASMTCALLALALFPVSSVRAETNAPRAAAAAESSGLDLAKSAACVERMRELQDALGQMETAAVASNETARAECIRERHTKVIGLLELSQTAHDRLRGIAADDITEQDEAEFAKILLACGRAEKTAAEAGHCTNEAPRKPKKRREADRADNPANPDASGKRDRLFRRRQPVERNERTCLRQEQLAALLATVMELGVDTGKSLDASSKELSKLAIEPLDGWQPNDCATLDDLCVAVARALNLKVEKPDDPVSYAQALRDEGLPVDTLLPARIPDGPPPLLLEPEVRAFFLTGYAAPLPTSRRLVPD